MFVVVGTLMPQVNDVLLTDKSLRPFLTKFITSFLLEIGSINLSFFS